MIFVYSSSEYKTNLTHEIHEIHQIFIYIKIKHMGNFDAFEVQHTFSPCGIHWTLRCLLKLLALGDTSDNKRCCQV